MSALRRRSEHTGMMPRIPQLTFSPEQRDKIGNAGVGIPWDMANQTKYQKLFERPSIQPVRSNQTLHLSTSWKTVTRSQMTSWHMTLKLPATLP